MKYVCVPEPVMTDLSRTNGTFQMRVDEVLQPGTLVIEASTNLAGWRRSLPTPRPPMSLFYTDPEAGNHPGGFTGRSNSPKPPRFKSNRSVVMPGRKLPRPVCLVPGLDAARDSGDNSPALVD